MDNGGAETATVGDPGEGGDSQEIEKLRQDNERLRRENKDYKSRLHGVQTLGLLLEESRHEKESLRDQVTELSTRLSLITAEESGQSKDTTTLPTENVQEKKEPGHENVTPGAASSDKCVHHTEGLENGSVENNVSTDSTASVEDELFGGGEPDRKSASPSPGQPLRSLEEVKTLPPEGHEMAVSGEPLSDQAQRLEAALHSRGPRKSTEMAAEMARFGSRVLQMEKKYNIQSVLVRDLTAENEDLKMKLSDGLQEKNNTIRTLQDQIADLQSRRRAQEEQQGVTVDTTQPIFKQNDEKQQSAAKEISDLKHRLEDLNRQKKEIIDVNKQWDVQYRSMKGSLEGKLEEAHRQVTEYRVQEEKRQRDIDKMLLSAKKRIDAEQEATEKAVQDYNQEKQRGDTLSARVTLLENQVTDMMRQRGNLEAEIRRLNAVLGEAPSIAIRTPPSQATERQQSPARQSPPPSHQTQPGASLDARTEIEVLRAQVATYREDFETERGDRERIQGEKETLRDEMVALRLQVDYLSQQLRVYEEDFHRERRQTERLQRELRRRPMAADEPAAYNAAPRQQEYVPPPQTQLYPQPPPYQDAPPHYQHYYRPADADIQQRELNRYPQGRLTPRGSRYPPGRVGSQVMPRTLPTNVEHDCADSPINQTAGDCPRCQRLFDNPRDLQDHMQRCIT